MSNREERNIQSMGILKYVYCVDWDSDDNLEDSM